MPPPQRFWGFVVWLVGFFFICFVFFFSFAWRGSSGRFGTDKEQAVMLKAPAAGALSSVLQEAVGTSWHPQNTDKCSWSCC